MIQCAPTAPTMVRKLAALILSVTAKEAKWGAYRDKPMPELAVLREQGTEHLRPAQNRTRYVTPQRESTPSGAMLQFWAHGTRTCGRGNMLIPYRVCLRGARKRRSFEGATRAPHAPRQSRNPGLHAMLQNIAPGLEAE